MLIRDLYASMQVKYDQILQKLRPGPRAYKTLESLDDDWKAMLEESETKFSELVGKNPSGSSSQEDKKDNQDFRGKLEKLKKEFERNYAYEREKLDNKLRRFTKVPQKQ
jgi:hypothetical protein